MWTGSQWVPPPPIGGVAHVSTTQGVHAVGAWGLLAGGLAIIVGSLLPWATATAPFAGTVSRSGTDGGGDGIITIALGLVICLAGVSAVQRVRSGIASLAGVLAVVAGVLVVYEYSDASSRVQNVSAASDLVVASVGAGIWVMGLGAVVALVGALEYLGRNKTIAAKVLS